MRRASIKEFRGAVARIADLDPVIKEEVLEELKYSNGRKAQGQDDMPAWFLKTLALELAGWPTEFVNSLLSSQVVPTISRKVEWSSYQMMAFRGQKSSDL